MLSLPGNRIGGPGLVHLRGLADLQVLNLARNPVVDDGLAHLSGLKEPNTLTLAETAVTGQVSIISNRWPRCGYSISIARRSPTTT